MGRPDNVVMVGVPASELDLCRTALRQQQHLADYHAQVARDRQESIEALRAEVWHWRRRPNWLAVWVGTVGSVGWVLALVLAVLRWGVPW